MNKDWAELNKAIKLQMKKESTYEIGIETLLNLRNHLMQTIISFKEELSRNQFDAIPFINTNGYHSKTIAYSLWHTFRIEDIVLHTLIEEDEQVFFKENYQKRINSPIITTGNELVKQEIQDFSKQLNLEELYSYMFKVKNSTEQIIQGLTYDQMKRKIPEDRKEFLKSIKVVSTDESAVWLIDYWCDKNIRGLIQMPFSRHWIMHLEASMRIKNEIYKRNIN